MSDRTDYSDREPSLCVTDGTTTIGYVVDDRVGAVALDPNLRLIGRCKTRKEAVALINERARSCSAAAE